jgi:uncharacterized protein (DUF1501 family)
MPMTGGRAVDFIARTALDAHAKLRRNPQHRGPKRSKPGRVSRQSPLGNSLKLVAKLIGGGLPTRIYYVSQGGYDTHTNQVATQQRLLGDLGDSMKAFVDDLKAQGNMQRVLVMTFSEFGRRVSDNANGGTDHGAAAPMFIVGGKVKAGLLGKYPSLAPQDLFEGDIKYNVDFRNVYAGILWPNAITTKCSASSANAERRRNQEGLPQARPREISSGQKSGRQIPRRKNSRNSARPTRR